MRKIFSFKSIIFDSETSKSSFSGVNLEEGNYWWRISANQGTFHSDTPGKRLSVVGEYSAPVLIEPNETKKAVVRPAQEFTFQGLSFVKKFYFCATKCNV